MHFGQLMLHTVSLLAQIAILQSAKKDREERNDVFVNLWFSSLADRTRTRWNLLDQWELFLFDSDWNRTYCPIDAPSSGHHLNYYWPHSLEWFPAARSSYSLEWPASMTWARRQPYSLHSYHGSLVFGRVRHWLLLALIDSHSHWPFSSFCYWTISCHWHYCCCCDYGFYSNFCFVSSYLVDQL